MADPDHTNSTGPDNPRRVADIPVHLAGFLAGDLRVHVDPSKLSPIQLQATASDGETAVVILSFTLDAALDMCLRTIGAAARLRRHQLRSG